MFRSIEGRRYPARPEVQHAYRLVLRLILFALPLVLAACNKNGGGPGY